VRPATAAGHAAGWRGRRAPTDGGSVVRGDRSTGRRPPCAVAAGGSTHRLAASAAPSTDGAVTPGPWGAATADDWGVADGAATAVDCRRCGRLRCGSLV